MSYCAPGVTPSDGSCFDLASLKKIAAAFNSGRPASEQIQFNSRTPKRQLWESIRQKLSNVCQNEWCWIDQGFVKGLGDSKIEKMTFRAPRPKGDYDWLTTGDIHQVMKQYEEEHPDFIFFGPVPIDFQVVNEELRHINVAQLYRKGKRQLGIVFNLDPSYKPGSHWVGLYANLDDKVVSFFDSYGIKPCNQIQALMGVIAGSYRDFGNPKKKFTININTHRHQYANTECGVYSMYFIVQSLKGKGFQEIVSQTILDEEMHGYRNVFFRPLTR